MSLQCFTRAGFNIVMQCVSAFILPNYKIIETDINDSRIYEDCTGTVCKKKYPKILTLNKT